MSGRRLRVLLIEDEAITAVMTELGLRQLHYEVSGVASSVEAGIAAARENGFDVAVLDLKLRGRLAYPVAEELARQRIPFVVASAYAVAENAPEALRRAPYVPKPYGVPHLHQAVAAALAAI